MAKKGKFLILTHLKSMAQLMIIDVQQTFEGSQDLDEKILELSKGYGDIILLQDVISGDGVFPYDMWTEMALAYEEGDFNPRVITKEYGFFRNLMDEGFDDELIVDLARFLISKGLRDGRDIQEDLSEQDMQEYQKVLKKHGVEDIDFESYILYIPDLKEDLEEVVSNGVVLVGGGLNECLKEVSLLLDVLGISHSVDMSCVY